MKIAGLQKTTLLDYPEQIAAVIFTAGCNFCCPFCHNRDLVLGEGLSLLSEEEVLAFLDKRKKVLTGICITGGEPTIQPDIREFLLKVRQMGYLIKLDTNGYRPDRIELLLHEGLLDYIAMDVKNSIHKYVRTTGCREIELVRIRESVNRIKQSGIAHEFRTTVVSELHTEEDIMEMGEWIGGGESYYLQGYVESETVILKGFHPVSEDEMYSYAKRLTEKGIRTMVRGV